MRPYSLKTRILIPLSLAMAVLLAVFGVSFYRFQQKQMNDKVVSKLEAVQELFVAQLENDADMMGAALHILLRDEQLKAALKAKDKTALLDQTLDQFGQLNAEHQITHLYFTGPDRVNILRVHKPEKHGDRIDRFTTLEAEKTGRASYGIELGPLGTFTLRVVHPWYDGQQLIGYVELGEEIEHITRKLHDIIAVEIYVVIEKKYLDRAGWESGMRMLGRDANWKRFPSVVMIDHTQEELPEGLTGFLAEEHHTSMKTDVDVSFKDRRYRTRFIHLNDAGGRGVGDMVVMTDVTDLVAHLHAAVFTIAAICLGVGSVLFALLFLFLQRVERQMATGSEELIRVSKAVESTSDAIIMFDLSGQPIYQNKASLELFGYTVEELRTAGGLLSMLHTDPGVEHEVFDTLTGGKACRREAEMRTRTGSIRLVSLRADTIKGEKGEILGFICIYTDITERKQVEEALRQSEEKFRNLSTELDLGLSEVFKALKEISSGNPEVRIPETSEIELITELKHMVNLTAENLGEIVNLSHEFAIGLAEHFDALHRVSEGDLTARVLGHPQVELLVGLKKVTNQMIESVSREMTQRKLAQETLLRERDFSESAINSMPGTFYMIDDKGNFVRWNENLEKVTLYSGEEISRMHPLDFFGGEEKQIIADRIQEVFVKGKTSVEANLISKNGRKTPYFLTGLRTRIGDSTYLVGMGIDITERKRAEEKLKEYSEKLEQMVEERTKELQEAQEQLVRREKLATLGQLAGGLGHELRNPLGAIKNAIYLLNMVLEDPEPEVKETLEIIEKEVGISEGVITSLLDFARPKPPTRHIVDINDVVEAAMSRVPVPENVEVVRQFSKTLPTISADPVQLTQVFGNLVLNAVQAMPEGGRLVVKSEAPSHKGLTLSFIDTGVGMDEETLEKAFEPLFTIKSKGIGLGLALCKMFVEAHGGTIDVESKVGKGTSFTVKLPAG